LLRNKAILVANIDLIQEGKNRFVCSRNVL
jgi:hypothetical protein